jgi:hypothetical protein
LFGPRSGWGNVVTGQDKDASGASVSVDIKTEVPSTSSGRTLDAITDLLRPISESFGYIGDKIQLRRQTTLLEIARRAKERRDTIESQSDQFHKSFSYHCLKRPA